MSYFVLNVHENSFKYRRRPQRWGGAKNEKGILV
jgi:hypothetical protein